VIYLSLKQMTWDLFRYSMSFLWRYNFMLSAKRAGNLYIRDISRSCWEYSAICVIESELPGNRRFDRSYFISSRWTSIQARYWDYSQTRRSQSIIHTMRIWILRDIQFRKHSHDYDCILNLSRLLNDTKDIERFLNAL